ncbi:MAG: hypothetical protein IKO42_00880 [Opitutales bacterium]|nr:hypothetical protein [Opitutales bacterium]
MMLRILKGTRINGATAPKGKVLDPTLMKKSDIALLLANGQAELFQPGAKPAPTPAKKGKK